MTFHEESDAPGSQDSVTGGAGGSAASHASSALISEPEFFLDLGKARLLVNSSPQPGGPACKARSIIGRKSFTFWLSNHRFCVLAHANISSSDFERRSGRSATAITSWPSVHRLALELTDRQAVALASAISDTTTVAPEIARLQGIALAGAFQIIISEAGQRTREGQSQPEIANELHPIIENVLDELDRWLSV